MAEDVLYSSILQDFARPLLHEADTDEMFKEKMKLAEVIWNYCIAREFKLPHFDEINKVLGSEGQKHPETKQIFDQLAAFKEANFKRYKNFILKVEHRVKSGGEKTLYVESAHPNHLR
ncbi:hypothetical protein [Foetidibacter luteolus]|uniref:hypothetical protein n=1 Tax=Foetidibacter luteolus TaxID=2608880 RepID=UPI00129C0C3C|nr:hypothetical protein [Foetidibacter luteolus]